MLKKTVSFVSATLFALFACFSDLSAQQVDCTAIGQRVAAEQAGQLTKATTGVQNGRNVCIVVVIVPGKGGEKPRRVEIAVPAN